MDLNTIIGFALIGVILVWFSYTRPDAEPIETTTDTEVRADSLNSESATPKEFIEESPIARSADSSVFTEQSIQKYGAFNSDVQIEAQEELFTLENNSLRLIISSVGGQLIRAEVKNYQTYDSLPIELVKLANSQWSYEMQAERLYSTKNLFYTGVQKGNQLTLSAPHSSGRTLKIKYALAEEGHALHMEIEAEGLGITQSGFQWDMDALRQELNIEAENQQTGLYFAESEKNKVDNLSLTGEDSELLDNLKWVAFKQQFFSSVIVAQDKFTKAELASLPLVSETSTKRMGVRMRGTDNENFIADWYFVPNKYNTLEEYGYNMDELIPMGWGIFGWINRGIVVNIFKWLESYGMNYGIIILIMAVLIKMVLFPLTYKSYLSMAKMRVLKPEMDELNEKFKDKEASKKQQALMELYRKAGVNPLGGCIPVVLQFPILIALFRFFPSSIELRQQGFLWATDLSTYDSIYNLPFNIPFYGDHISLFTLLMTLSTLLYTYFNNQMTPQNNQFPQLKYMMYLMPVVFLGVFNNYASGLSYYYFVANMLTFGQQFGIRYFVNDDAIHAKLQENKKKPKKQSKFSKRLEEIAEKQQESTNRKTRRK